jgi:hypothetical protein
VTASGTGNHPGTRIHAIVLTRNRPETLRRCIALVLTSLGPEDMLTILDDSLPAVSPANAALLARTPSVSPTRRVHLLTSRAREVIADSVSGRTLLWLSKTAPRDIAPLRNLSMLLSVATSAETTVLIDDDIYGFDLFATHNAISELAQDAEGVIAGAEIDGINEQDTVTRLIDAVKMLEKLPPGAKARSIRDLFEVPVSSHSGMGNDSRYVSAGCLAFRLPPERMFAFPPGYNEDWLWCLLQSGNSHVRILRLGQKVVHDPPSVRRPTRGDLLFELAGDLVFECLEERDGRNDLNPEAALTALSNRIPRPAFMPSARVLELLENARSSSENGICLSALEEYGLAVLSDMLRAGELDMDGARVLTDWCGDAIAKHRSLAATLHDERAIFALKTIMQEGRP